MVWSPRFVPRHWTVPADVRTAFLEGRFDEVVANAGGPADRVFQVLIPAAGFFEEIDTARAGAAFALDNDVLPTDDAVCAEALALGYAERPASQTRTLRRWLDTSPTPESWLRAAHVALRSGPFWHALGYASVGLRLAARDAHASDSTLLGLANVRTAVHAGELGVNLIDVMREPPPERLDAKCRALISSLFVSDVPPLPCDDEPGLDDEAFRRAMAIVLGHDEPSEATAGGTDSLVVAGFFPLHEYYAARTRWYDLVHNDATDYLREFAKHLHRLVVSGYHVIVVPLSVVDLDRWMGVRGITTPRRWVRDEYLLPHTAAGRRWTGDPDASCWCGNDSLAKACTHTPPGVEPPHPLRPRWEPANAAEANIVDALDTYLGTVLTWWNGDNHDGTVRE